MSLKGYFKIPRVVFYNVKVGAKDLCVYAALASMAREGRVEISRGNLGRLARVSPATLQKALNNLKGLGFLTWKSGFSMKNEAGIVTSFRSNTYELTNLDGIRSNRARSKPQGVTYVDRPVTLNQGKNRNE